MLIVVLAVAAGLGASPVFAQTAGTGALTGTITDPVGAVVVDAQIKVINETTGESRTVSSRQDGVYLVPLLPPGSYRLEAGASGFKQVTRSGVRVSVTETATLNLQLEVGASTESITIAAAPTVVQTESSALGRVTDEKVITNLPLVTRNFTEIIGLSPGVNAGVTNAAEFGRGSGGQVNFANNAISVHGARTYDNNFQLNGVGINDLFGSGGLTGGIAVPNPDTIEQFKVQTGQYDAAFGRNAGANVNLVTKSGSKEFHGTLFEFFRNEALNANDFFFNRIGREKGRLRQNQFGFTLGGPVRKDKLLFFGSYQGTRQQNGIAGQCRRTYNAPPLTDDRSAAAIGRLFAGRRGALQGNVGPAILADGSNINPIALRLLQMKLPSGSFLIPTPQRINPSLPFDQQGLLAFSDACRFDEEQFLTNLDYLHTDKSKLAGRFFYASSDQTISFPGGNVRGFPQIGANDFRNFSLAHSYVLSPRLLNEAQFGFHRIDVAIDQKGAFKFSDIGVASIEQANDLPVINIVGSYNVGGSFPTSSDQDVFAIQDTLSYLRGRHALRFGGSLSRTKIDFSNFRFNGQPIFLSFPDFLLGLSAAQNGSPFSNVFGSLDLPGQTDRKFRIVDGSLYVQDDFKLKPRLTLNLGLRYERLGHFADQLGRNGGFDIALANPNPPAAGSQAGYVVSANTEAALPVGVTRLDNEFGIDGEGQNNWALRVGFAWQVLPRSSRLVLRGGYGMYFSRLVGQQFVQVAFVPPFAELRFISGIGNAAATFANPFPQPLRRPSDYPIFPSYSPTTAFNTRFLAPDYRPSVTQQYSLNLQTQMAKDFLVEIGYVGTRGTKLLRTRSLNQALLASPTNPIRGVTTNTVANILLRVPVQGFVPTGLQQIETAGASWYNGLEASLTKRFSRGLQFLAAYTFSRAFDTDGGNVVASSAGNTLGLGDQNDPRQRYGPTSLNREHRLIISYVYELPTLAQGHPFFTKLFGGWAVAGVTTFQSGQRLTITATNANNAFGITTDRAQLAAGCTHSQVATAGSLNSRLDNYFNRSCFAPFPVIGSDGRATGFGNSGAGIATGPDQRNFDIAVIKRTAVGWPTEASNVEFRAEFFNAFNTPQFAGPVTNFSAANFGGITSTAVSPRLIQFALKFNF